MVNKSGNVNKSSNKGTLFLKIIIGVLLIAGIGTVLYPYISGWIFNKQTEAKIGNFQTKEQYIELKRAFEEYNKDLALNGQSHLEEDGAYRTFPIDPSDYGAGNMAGYIEIPSQNIKMAIYLGASDKNMAKGAGVMGYTSAPIGGINTNCVIASHDMWKGATRFKKINRLNPGDAVYVTNLWEKLTYTVVERKTVSPRDGDAVLIRAGQDMVTLVTCDNYGPNGPDRCIVYCTRTK